MGIRHRKAGHDIVDDRKTKAYSSCLEATPDIYHEVVQRNQTVPASAGDVPKEQKDKVAVSNAAPSRDLNFKCVDCEKAFRSKQGLQTHVRQVHELRMCEKSQSKEKLLCRFC